MSPRYGATHVEHDASKQWNAVEDQYEIEVARCYQKWGRRMPPRSHVAEYLRWDSMREDELDRLKVQRDKALKAIPMNRTPGVRSKSTPPKRPPRPVSPPTSYALSAITSMVADTPQPLAKSVESDASGKPPRPARRPRPVSAISVASSSVTHHRKAALTRTPPSSAPGSPVMSGLLPSPTSSTFSTAPSLSGTSAERARVFNRVLYAAQSQTMDPRAQNELRKLAQEFHRLNR